MSEMDGEEGKDSGAIERPGLRRLTAEEVGAKRAEQLETAKQDVAAFSDLVAELQALLRSVYSMPFALPTT